MMVCFFILSPASLFKRQQSQEYRAQGFLFLPSVLCRMASRTKLALATANPWPDTAKDSNFQG